jgi:hypothetical protein
MEQLVNKNQLERKKDRTYDETGLLQLVVGSRVAGRFSIRCALVTQNGAIFSSTEIAHRRDVG